MKRRDLLKLALAGPLVACARTHGPPRVGLALGGGGAKGLAHVPMLEVLDELGVRPHRIAGTSIGAVMGALYASGKSGGDIRRLIDDLTVSGDESWVDALFEEDLGRWWDFIDLRLGRGGLVDSTGFADWLGRTLGARRFRELEIPLAVVATDFWSREQVVFQEGELMPAIRASIALPGLFAPVRYRDRVLVDGGLVNPVPWDLLMDDCDLVVAIDVSGTKTPEAEDASPSWFETVFSTFQILQASIVDEKRRHTPPDIYVRPALENIRVLEFQRVDEIYASARVARDELRASLQRRL